MDVKFNIFPTSNSFSAIVGEPANTKDRGDINVIEDKKMMILNGEKYKFDNHNKKQKWCGPGIYVDKIFMGKNAWVPTNVPVGYKCLIRKGQHVLKYSRTIFFRYNSAGSLKLYETRDPFANVESNIQFTDMGKWIKIFTGDYIPKGSFKWVYREKSNDYTGIKVPSNRGNSWKCSVKLYRYMDTVNTAYTWVCGTCPGHWIYDGVAKEDILLQKMRDKNSTDGEQWDAKRLPPYQLVVSRNGLLTYYEGRIDYKIPDATVYNVCMKFAKDLLNGDINTEFVNKILNKKHLRYYFQVKCKRRYTPVKLSNIQRNKTAGKPTRITDERERIVSKTRRMWKNIYSDMPGQFYIPNLAHEYPGVFVYSNGRMNLLSTLSVKRKFVQQKDEPQHTVNVVRYWKLNYIDFRLIRRIGNDYIFDQNCRNIRINYSNTTDKGYPDYKRITIDTK